MKIGYGPYCKSIQILKLVLFILEEVYLYFIYLASNNIRAQYIFEATYI